MLIDTGDTIDSVKRRILAILAVASVLVVLGPTTWKLISNVDNPGTAFCGWALSLRQENRMVVMAPGGNFWNVDYGDIQRPFAVYLLAYLVWLSVRAGKSGQPGILCSKWGYDLRATPDRCPECGTGPAGD